MLISLHFIYLFTILFFVFICCVKLNGSAYAKLRNRLPKELRDSSFTDILQVNFKGFTFTVRV